MFNGELIFQIKKFNQKFFMKLINYVSMTSKSSYNTLPNFQVLSLNLYTAIKHFN